MLKARSDFLTTQYKQNLHITGTLKGKKKKKNKTELNHQKYILCNNETNAQK